MILCELRYLYWYIYVLYMGYKYKKVIDKKKQTSLHKEKFKRYQMTKSYAQSHLMNESDIFTF